MIYLLRHCILLENRSCCFVGDQFLAHVNDVTTKGERDRREVIPSRGRLDVTTLTVTSNATPASEDKLELCLPTDLQRERFTSQNS